jgi:hypothetical protein
MKWRKQIASGVLAGVLAFAGTARAAGSNDVDTTHDARTEGYTTPVQLEGTTSLLWIGFILLSIISMSALFKDSKRARTE